MSVIFYKGLNRNVAPPPYTPRLNISSDPCSLSVCKGAFTRSVQSLWLKGAFTKLLRFA